MSIISQLPPEIWFSIFLVFAVIGSAVAVLVPLVKKRNKRLREMTVRLRACQEECERHAIHQRLTAAVQLNDKPVVDTKPTTPAMPPLQVAASSDMVAAVAPVLLAEAVIETATENVKVAAIPAAVPMERDSEIRDRTIAILEADFASPQERRRHPAPARRPVAKLEDMNPKEALSDWLNRRAAARSPQQQARVTKIEPAAEAVKTVAVDLVDRRAYMLGKSTTFNDPPDTPRVTEKVSEVAVKMKDKVADLGQTAVDKSDENRESTARRLESAASALHEKAQSLPGGEKITSLAHSTADKLNDTAEYVRKHDVKRMMADVEQLVKNNPGPSLLAAVVIGFLVGRAFSSND